MCTGDPLCAVDGEGVRGDDTGIFCRPGDVIPGYGEVGHLGVEVICVAEGGVGVSIWDGEGLYPIRVSILERA